MDYKLARYIKALQHSRVFLMAPAFAWYLGD